jgi:2-phospho-L-lactate guanylyltransferase
MDAVVPFDAESPKTRLSALLDADQRRDFATAMCRDVLAAVRAAGGDPELLATADPGLDAPVTVDDRPLTEAVNDRLADHGPPVAVVMADLALATPEALSRLFGADGRVVLVPGRGGGTNAFLTRHPEFRVDYHGGSIRDHRRGAADLGVTPTELDSFRLGTDVDEPADLVEVLLHTDGHAAEWLRTSGFDVRTVDGRLELDTPD